MAKQPQLVQVGSCISIRLRPPNRQPSLGPFYDKAEALRALNNYLKDKQQKKKTRAPSKSTVELQPHASGWEVVARIRRKSISIGVWKVRTKAKRVADAVEFLYSKRTKHLRHVFPAELWPPVRDALVAAGLPIPTDALTLI